MKPSSQLNRFFNNPLQAIARMKEIASAEKTTAYVVCVRYGRRQQPDAEYSVRLAGEMVCAPVTVDFMETKFHKFINPEPALILAATTYHDTEKSDKNASEPETEADFEIIPVVRHLEKQENISKISYWDFHMLNKGYEFIDAQGQVQTKLSIYNWICDEFKDPDELTDALTVLSEGSFMGITLIEKKGWNDGKLINH